MLSLLFVLAFQSKTMNYDLFRGDQSIGDAKVLIRITQDGGKRTDTKLTLRQGGKTLEMHTTQVWAFSGRPTLKIVQIFDAKGVETSRTRVDFKATEAVVSKTVGDKTTKSAVPIEAKTEIRDLTEFWFIRDEPEKGKPYEYLTFDANALKWERAKSIYLGEEAKTIQGKKMSVHHVSQEIGGKRVDIWLESDGFPVLTEAADKTKIVAKF